MDNEGIQSISSPKSKTPIQLPEEIILYISKFLDGEDALSLSLAFSDVFKTVPSIYWKKIQENQKSISISQCYYLRDVLLWKQELEHNIELAKNLISFNACHCSWLPLEALLETLSKMPNLEQLLIHDTKITLAHLPTIFKSCQKLNKLSFKLAEENLDKFTKAEMGEEDFSWLMKGFKRLTHLKLFTYNLSDNISSTSWPVTFGVLGWCSRRCIDLYIEVAYPPPAYYSTGPLFSVDFCSRLPLMGEEHSWISSLKSLVFIARGSLPRDRFVQHLLERFARQREPNSFERLWVERLSADTGSSLDWNNNDVPMTKSLVLWPEDRAYFAHDHIGLRQLENVANVAFSSLASKPNIKYIRGYCKDAEGLNEFCVEHPMVEHLHFSTAEEFKLGEDDTIITVGNWKLPCLKTLVYRCSFPVKEIIDHLVVACPNVEAFHIGKADDFDAAPSSQPVVDVNFLSAIKFSKLTSLSLNGFQLHDGSYMASILMQCPLLKSLHLSGAAQPGEFLRQLGECLPKATHLRDLRVQLFNREEETDVLDFLKKLRGCSNHLQRLVFCTVVPCDFSGPTNAAEFRSFLTSFPSEMPRLVFFGLAGVIVNADDCDVITRYFRENVLSVRKSFGLSYGPLLPYGNVLGFPRIHLDGMVRPIDWFRAPPRFDDIDSQETED